MGNRALVEFDELSVYLHWNGGPESIARFMGAMREACSQELLTKYPNCAAVRLCQLVGNWFAGTTSIGLNRTDPSYDGSGLDNGVYVVGDGCYITAVREGGADYQEYLDSRVRKANAKLQGGALMEDEMTLVPVEEAIVPTHVVTVPKAGFGIVVQLPDDLNIRDVFAFCETFGHRSWSVDDYGGARLAQILCNLVPEYCRVTAALGTVDELREQYPDAEVLVLSGWRVEGESTQSGDGRRIVDRLPLGAVTDDRNVVVKHLFQ